VRALIVDDSRAMRTILGKMVASLGFEVTTAIHGKDALEQLGAGLRPELMLVDWNMPEMNGLEFVTAVRAEPRYKSMTLMMVTTESEQSQIVRALAAGAHEYVIKPFTPDAIVEKLALLGLVPNGAAA
jgi:two-component system, chemotaxis family, chemotaxis protein CheY